MVTNDDAHLQSQLFGGLKQNYELKTSLDNTSPKKKKRRPSARQTADALGNGLRHQLWELNISNMEAKRSETRLIFYESEDVPQNVGLLTYIVTCRT